MSKLPEFVYDTYTRYKVDTNRLARWLVTTAERLGYEGLKGRRDAEVSEGGQEVQSGEHRKAKNKRRSTGAKAKTDPNAQPEKRILAVAQFTELAEFIAKSGEAVKIPRAVLTVARSAIAARKGCAGWFRDVKAAGGSDGQSDDRHWHFIAVLEKVVDILEKCEVVDIKGGVAGRGAGQREGTNATKECDVEIENRFAMLELDDLVDAHSESLEPHPPLHHATTTSRPAKPAPIVEVMYETEEDQEDIRIFISYCFFRDLNAIRNFLRQLWDDYKNNRADLATASVTTTAAFEIVRRMEEEFYLVIPNLPEVNHVCAAGLIYLNVGIKLGENTMDYDSIFDVKIPDGLRDVGDFCFWPGFIRLMHILMACNPPHGQISNVSGTSFGGRYNPSADRSSLTPDEQQKEDLFILFDLVNDFIAVNWQHDDFPYKRDDPFICDLTSWRKHKSVRTTLVFMFQIFLDVHHTFRQNVSQALLDLRSFGVQNLMSIKQWSFTLAHMKMDPMDVRNKDLHKLVLFIERYICKDALERDMANIQNTRRLPGFPEAFHLLAHHPISCGMIKYRLQLQVLDTAIKLANEWGSILYTGHLYHLCSEVTKDLVASKSWVDMEWIFDHHGRERLFRGRMPETLYECFRSFSLVWGMQAQDMVPLETRRKKQGGKYHVKKKLPKRPQGVVTLTTEWPVAEFMKKWLLEGKEVEVREFVEVMGRGFDMEDVDEVATPKLELFLKEDTSTPNGVEVQTDKESNTAASSPHPSTTSAPNNVASKAVAPPQSPTQLLSSLSTSFKREHPLLTFNYISLHTRCILTLLHIDSLLHDDLTLLLDGFDWVNKASDIGLLPHWIMMGADRELGPRKSRSGDCQDTRNSLMVGKAGRILREVVEKEGAIEVGELRRKMGGGSEEKEKTGREKQQDWFFRFKWGDESTTSRVVESEPNTLH
ncbi:hypothetical protein HDV00_002941 [Rhizophlyctis rosea]|nr:hypothetical protein HDV00_002941 [Rhizophlyctis rosea]